MKIDWRKFLISLVVCNGAGAIGAAFTFSAIPVWYAGLNKPWFNPPAWVFGPAWTALYVLMAVALYSVWVKKEFSKAKNAYFLFSIQLVLNALWSIIFFGMKSPGLAFLEIIFLWLAIGLTAKEFYKISKPAAYLLLPYLAWVSFAALLNFSVWTLNP